MDKDEFKSLPKDEKIIYLLEMQAALIDKLADRVLELERKVKECDARIELQSNSTDLADKETQEYRKLLDETDQKIKETRPKCTNDLQIEILDDLEKILNSKKRK